MSELPPATPPSPDEPTSPEAPTPQAPPAADAARAKQRRQQVAWPAPTPQVPADGAALPTEPLVPAQAPPPVEPPPVPAVEAPPAEPPAPARVSLAGAGMPAFFGKPDPVPAAAPPVAAPEPTLPAQEATPTPAAPAEVQASLPTVELPAEQGSPSPTAPVSTAPPGFSAPRVQAAASPTLLAVEPDQGADEVPDADGVASAPTEPPGLPRLILGGLPRRDDLPLVGRDRGATIRVIRAAAAVILAAVLLGPALISALEGIGFMATAIDHVRAILRFPGTYGMPWLTGIFGVVSLVGVVLANMERYGERMGDRRTPVRRVNIALGTLLATALAGGLFATFAARGWAAAVATTTFWVLLCFVVPLGRTPGGWAMRFQPERAWAYLFIASVVSVGLEPSLPGMLIAVLAFTRVRTNWAGVRDDLDAHADGPVDTTNRRSALILVLAALVAGSVGLNAMSVDSRSLPTAETESPFPYAKEGPTVDPGAVNPDGPSPTPEVPTTPAATPAPTPETPAPAPTTPAEESADDGAASDAPPAETSPDAPVESTPPPSDDDAGSSGGVGVLR